MSKANSLKNKITNKKGSPAREFLNAYAQEEEVEAKRQAAPAVATKEPVARVRNTEMENDIDSNSNIKSDMDDASNDNSNQEVFSVIDNLLEKEKSKPVKEFVGLYLDEDVHQGLNSLSKKSKQRGMKSKIVNDILRSIFEQQGIIKPR